jgi:hypothetical protein
MRVDPLSAADTANQSMSVLASDLRLAGTGGMRAFERAYMATSAKVMELLSASSGAATLPTRFSRKSS